MAKLGALYQIIDKKINKDVMENLQLGERQWLEKIPINIVTLMLMDCNIRHECKAVS
jgi:hypothetical protein